MNYNVVKILSEEEILSKRLNRLIFIDGAAIYSDSNCTNRRIYTKFSNFNTWLEDYSNINKLCFFTIRAIIKKFVDGINKNIDEIIDTKTTSINFFEVPIEFYKDISEILAPNKSQINDYVNLQVSVWHYLSFKNNVTIVKLDGSFLMDEKFRYFNNIQINKEGLFRCNSKRICYHRSGIPGKIVMSSDFYIIDCQGNLLFDEEYNKLLCLLSSKNKHYNFLYEKFNQIDRINEIEDLEKYLSENVFPNFKFTYHEWRRSDSWFIAVYIENEDGNKLHLDRVIRGLKMLMNGEKYLQSLSKFFIDSQYSFND